MRGFSRVVGRIFAAIALLAAWIGIVYLPTNAKELPEALQEWRELVPISGETALIWFSGFLLLWVLWTDLRPLIRPWLIKQFPALDESHERISLVDFAEIAKRKYGWVLGNDSLDSLDLIDGIRQAAIDGTITLEGRERCHSVPEELKPSYPLVSVSVNTLAQASIEAPGFFDSDIGNFYIKIIDRLADPSEKYRDIHINDKTEAIKWLRKEGPEWKGRREELDKIREERVKAREAAMRQAPPMPEA